MDAKLVMTFVILMIVAPVGIAVGTVVVYKTTSSLDVTGGREYTTDNTNGRYMDENTATTRHWENHYTENHVAWFDNGLGKSTGSNHFLQDYDNGICYWYQALAISTVQDGVSSATIAFSYQLSDNSGLLAITSPEDDGLVKHTLKVTLQRPGGDNVTVWENLSKIPADNATWYTQENDVTSLITAPGTYTLYLFDNAVTAGLSPTGSNRDNVVVRWDNAYVEIVTYGKDYLENTVELVEENTGTGLGLGSLLPLVIGAVSIVSIVIVGFSAMYKPGSTRR